MGDRDAFTSPGLNSLTYPRFLLFMFAVLPQFVVPVAGPVWLQLLVLGVFKSGLEWFPGFSRDGIKDVWKRLLTPGRYQMAGTVYRRCHPHDV
jgi:threonine/homoserine/homoserine lactone efflux protein